MFHVKRLEGKGKKYMFHVKRFLEGKEEVGVSRETFGGKREEVFHVKHLEGKGKVDVSRETFGKKEEVNIVRGINL